MTRLSNAICLLVWTSASVSAFQLPKLSSTTKTPFSTFYYNPQINHKPTSVSLQQPWSLGVTLLPDSEQNNKNQDFFFRAPFPAEIAVIPSELTDETAPKQNTVFWEPILESYWGPRIVLMCIAAIYGTNFPLGAIMNAALPASAATSARMVLATLALSPFVFKIRPHLRVPAILCGCGTALGYVTQSLALVDTDPSKVSFLGAATVIWCPFLEWLVEKKPMGIKDAPQTWLAAFLCMLGVGCLELWGVQDGALASVTKGCFLSARMVQKEPDQVLPITSVLIATSAFWAMVWSLMDGWIGQPGYEAMTLPNLLFADGYQTVAMAVVWTGLISTSLNFVIEISALGRVPPSEASVLLASEPLWAALLAATVFNQSTFGMNDYVGGAFIILSCLANATLKPEDFHSLWGRNDSEKAEQTSL
jgi:drug/metabolite transporter (DMT)-like permease